MCYLSWRFHILIHLVCAAIAEIRSLVRDGPHVIGTVLLDVR